MCFKRKSPDKISEQKKPEMGSGGVRCSTRSYPSDKPSGCNATLILRLVASGCNRTKILPMPDGIAWVVLRVIADDQPVVATAVNDTATLATIATMR